MHIYLFFFIKEYLKWRVETPFGKLEVDQECRLLKCIADKMYSSEKQGLEILASVES